MGSYSAIRADVHSRQDLRDYLEFESPNPELLAGATDLLDAERAFSLLEAPRIFTVIVSETGKKDPLLRNPYRNAPLSNGHRVELNGNLYPSRPQAACAEMLRMNVPGFEGTPAEQTEIPVGRGKNNGRVHFNYVDFMVEGVLVEYHPPRLKNFGKRSNDNSIRRPSAARDDERAQRKTRGKSTKKKQVTYGEFGSRDEWVKFRRHLGSLRKDKRKEFIREVKGVLQQRYWERRRRVLDRNPAFRDVELIVVGSPVEFYREVICRFSPNPPPEKAFVKEFKDLQNQANGIKNSCSKRKTRVKSRRRGIGSYRNRTNPRQATSR